MNQLEWAQKQQDRIEEVGLLEVLKEQGIDPFASDKRNAWLRDEYGDTPYYAPDVNRITGKCPGGDAWPSCCEGHRFETRLDMIKDAEASRLYWEEQE